MRAVSLGTVAVVAFMIFAVAVIIYQRRTGGPGPQVNWVPRRWRRKVNERYAAHGWQQPFDAQGNRNPDRESL
jgi:hypothetical protein